MASTLAGPVAAPSRAPAPEVAGQTDDCCVYPEPALRPDEAARHAVVLKALADPQRLRMLSILAAQPAGEPLCVCDVEAAFALSQGTISHHLRVLREAGLVTVTKRGLWHYYALVSGALQPTRRLLAALDTADTASSSGP